MLKHIELRNFKSYGPEGTGSRLEPLSIVIGANGAGKSNLTRALTFLRDVLKEGLQRATTIHGGTGEVARSGATAREPVWLKTAVEVNKGQTIGVSLEALPGRQTLDPGKLQFEKITDSGSTPIQTFEPNQWTGNSLVSGYQSKRFEKRVESVLKDVLSWTRVSFDPLTVESIPMRGHTRFEKTTQVAEEGSNLAAVLLTLLMDHRERFDSIRSDLQGILPNIRDLDATQTEDGRPLFAFREHHHESRIWPWATSSGNLQVLFLLTLLHLPHPPGLVCLEHPEHWVHHDLLNTVAEILVHISNRAQLIVTTHSIELLNALGRLLTPEAIPVTVVSRDESGWSTLIEPKTTKELKHLIVELGLGGAYETGALTE